MLVPLIPVPASAIFTFFVLFFDTVAVFANIFDFGSMMVVPAIAPETAKKFLLDMVELFFFIIYDSCYLCFIYQYLNIFPPAITCFATHRTWLSGRSSARKEDIFDYQFELITFLVRYESLWECHTIAYSSI